MCDGLLRIKKNIKQTLRKLEKLLNKCNKQIINIHKIQRKMSNT